MFRDLSVPARTPDPPSEAGPFAVPDTKAIALSISGAAAPKIS
jgi:hypothetical protein